MSEDKIKSALMMMPLVFNFGVSIAMLFSALAIPIFMLINLRSYEIEIMMMYSGDHPGIAVLVIYFIPVMISLIFSGAVWWRIMTNIHAKERWKKSMKYFVGFILLIKIIITYIFSNYSYSYIRNIIYCFEYYIIFPISIAILILIYFYSFMIILFFWSHLDLIEEQEQLRILRNQIIKDSRDWHEEFMKRYGKSYD